MSLWIVFDSLEETISFLEVSLRFLRIFSGYLVIFGGGRGGVKKASKQCLWGNFRLCEGVNSFLRVSFRFWNGHKIK